jgi:hypothetical protein
VSNTQPGTPGLCIYVPQWKDDPTVTPGTRIPFRNLLQLAGLQWGYSNPPQRGRRCHATGIISDVLKETFGSRFLHTHGKHFEWATSFTSATLAQLIIWKRQYCNNCFQSPQELCKPYYRLWSFNFDITSHKEEHIMNIFHNDHCIS